MFFSRYVPRSGIARSYCMNFSLSIYIYPLCDLILSPGFSIPFICCQLSRFIASPNFSTKFLAYIQLNISTWISNQHLRPAQDPSLFPPQALLALPPPSWAISAVLCVLSRFRVFATLCTVGIFLARILEWVAMPSNRGSIFQTHGSKLCLSSSFIGRQVLYH